MDYHHEPYADAKELISLTKILELDYYFSFLYLISVLIP